MLKDLLALATARAKMAALVVGALAVGGMAASVGTTSFLPVDSSTDVKVAPSPTEAPDPEDTASSSDAPDAAPDVKPTDSATPAPCPTDVKNHGAYVSSVAKDHSTTGRAHGQAVSAAAHSDCGKSADDAASPEASDAPDPSEAPEATDAPEAPDSGDSGDSPGHGHSKHGHTHH